MYPPNRAELTCHSMMFEVILLCWNEAASVCRGCRLENSVWIAILIAFDEIYIDGIIIMAGCIQITYLI